MSSSELSAPNSPTSTAPLEDFADFKWNGLRTEGHPFKLEKIFDYEPSSHHPVHLGDYLGESQLGEGQLGEGRYRVLHKLGSGGFANVWLFRDMEGKEVTQYVMVKILMADTSVDGCPELRMNNKLKDLRLDFGEEAGAKYICLPLD